MAKAKSEWIDVSLPIYAGMIGGPKDPKVVMNLLRDPAKGDPVTMSQVTMSCHSGTHIDAPRHFFVDGAGVDELPLDTFIGPGQVIEIKDPDSIKSAELKDYDIRPGDRILFKTKNSSWVFDGEFFPTPYVSITIEAAHFLVGKKIKLVGIDYITVGGSENREANMTVHKIFLDAGIAVMEEVNLKGVKPGRYEVNAVPLRFRKGDAGHCRALIRPA
jgi:arylformamidase